MDYKPAIEAYSGVVREVVLGKDKKAVKTGGEGILPFHFFEGSAPNQPRFALEVYDREPVDWAEWALEPFKDVVSDPARWARKCAEDYGADAICLQLASTDPLDKDTSPEEAAALIELYFEKDF